jgi:hypothetical protein
MPIRRFAVLLLLAVALTALAPAGGAGLQAIRVAAGAS